MKRLITTLLLVLCASIQAQEDNIFLDREFWQSKPTLKEIKKKIKEGNDPTVKGPSGFDGTAYAIIDDAPTKSIKYMLSIPGNNVDKPTHGGIPYLLWAAYKGNLEVVQHLDELGANFDFSLESGTNILMMAAIGGNKDQSLYAYLFDKGLDPKYVNSDGSNAMHILASAEVNDINIFEYLVAQGLDWNSVDNNGNNLFSYAARGNNLELLKFCVDKGLDYKSINNKGENALLYATYSRRRASVKLDVFKYLEELGLEVDLVNWEGQTPLHNAIRYSDVEMIDFFVDRGVNVNQIDKNGNTALINAAGAPKESIEKLLSMTNFVNHKNKDGHSALTMAVRRASKDAFDLLLQNKADASIIDNEGSNLVAHAFETYFESRKENFEAIVNTLTKKKGLTGNEVYANGQTLAHIAIDRNSHYLLKKAIELGADLNHKNQDGVTPLHLAAMQSSDESLILALLDNGASKKILTEFDESAYDLALQNEQFSEKKVNINVLKTEE